MSATLSINAIRTGALDIRDSFVRDWLSASWMYEKTFGHTIEKVNASLVEVLGEAVATPIFQSQYTAAEESKLRAWEKVTARAIENWVPEQIAQLIAIFPSCIPLSCQGRSIEVRRTKDDWLCEFT